MENFTQKVLVLIKLSKPQAHVRLNYEPGDDVAKRQALNFLKLYLINKPISNMWELAQGIVLTISKTKPRIYNLFFHRQRWKLKDKNPWKGYRYCFKNNSFKEPVIGIILNIGRVPTNNLPDISAFIRHWIEPDSNPKSNWNDRPKEIKEELLRRLLKVLRELLFRKEEWQ